MQLLPENHKYSRCVYPLLPIWYSLLRKKFTMSVTLTTDPDFVICILCAISLLMFILKNLQIFTNFLWYWTLLKFIGSFCPLSQIAARKYVYMVCTISSIHGIWNSLFMWFDIQLFSGELASCAFVKSSGNIGIHFDVVLFHDTVNHCLLHSCGLLYLNISSVIW